MNFFLAEVPFGEVAPVIVMLAGMVIAVVCVLVNHQQKMAKIIHGYNPNQMAEDERKSLALKLYGPDAIGQMGQTSPDADRRLAAVEVELKEVKALLQQQAILLDDVLHRGKDADELKSRLSGS